MTAPVGIGPFDANVITNTVSTFVSSQFPEFIRDGSPAFVQFLQAYYEFLETANFGPNSNSVIYNAKNLLNYKDVDNTSDAFIQYFINDFLPYFPNDVALDERKLIKVARQFYQQKGTPQSIQFLFRVLYNKEADIYFPKDNILKLSDGKWTLPQALRLLLSSNNINFPVQSLVNLIGVGSQSGAQCVIEAANKVVDPNLGFEIVEVYVSNITKPFDDLESLMITYGADANGTPLIFEEKIIAALSSIQIDPHNQGLTYVRGDPVVLTGGLQENDPQAQKGVAFVGNVTTGSVTSINVNFGGYDYRQNPNTLVNITAVPGDNGVGATAIVSSLDTANSVFLEVNVDCLEFHQNNTIGGSGWGFANDSVANANTQMSRALTFANLEFAPIRTMTVVNQGGGYGKVPTIDMEVIYYTDLTDALELAQDPSAPSTFQNIDDLGIFAAVQILNQGAGYSNTRDSIYLNTNIGSNATFTFGTGANGGINVIHITNPGRGYIDIPNITMYLANAANRNAPASGTGAVLEPFGFGQGANLTVGVNKIGQIIDFNLVNRGFDYIAAPNVSLRIQDVVINPLGDEEFPFPDAIIFQGANANVATYTAFVDSEQANNVLRLYNYRGAINVFQNLVMTLTNDTVINVSINTTSSSPVTTYGNGLAKANAIFLNGLINFPGFYLNTDGWLSSDQYLQDANTYHNYSYQVIVEEALATYKSVLMQLAHPAGMSMLGIFAIPATEEVNTEYNSEIGFIQPLTGNINVVPYSLTVQGTLTDFVTSGIQPGDLLVYDTSGPNDQLVTSTITNVINNTHLAIESHKYVIYAGTANVANLGTNIQTSNSDMVGNVFVGDGLWLGLPAANGGINVATFNVTTVDPDFLIFDGLVILPEASANNIQVAFVRNHINASFQIVSAHSA